MLTSVSCPPDSQERLSRPTIAGSRSDRRTSEVRRQENLGTSVRMTVSLGCVDAGGAGHRRQTCSRMKLGALRRREAEIPERLGSVLAWPDPTHGSRYPAKGQQVLLRPFIFSPDRGALLRQPFSVLFGPEARRSLPLYSVQEPSLEFAYGPYGSPPVRRDDLDVILLGASKRQDGHRHRPGDTSLASSTGRSRRRPDSWHPQSPCSTTFLLLE